MALVHNAEPLKVDLTSLDGIVISHLHVDHVGGLRSQLRRTLASSAEPLEARELPAYVVPTQDLRRSLVSSASSAWPTARPLVLDDEAARPAAGPRGAGAGPSVGPASRRRR
jgi:ribonuclease BN (tRNA processing enzyme)